MNDRLRHLKRILTPAMGVALFLGIAGTTAISFAQTAAPKITSVTANTVTNTGAEITFSTDIAANAKIFYGPTTAYGTASPAINYTTPATTSHALTLDNLAPATTYHYQIEVKNGVGTTKSADRSFTTRSGTSSVGPLVLNNVVADCVDTRCQILFTPNRAATVRLVWDDAQHANFDDFPAANIVADNGVASAARRALVIPSQADGNNDGRPDVEFAPGTIYYYRLQAFEAGSSQPVLTTNTLQFTTSTNADDHTFSTGGCTLPNGTTIGIGQCGDSGYYCPSGGGEPVQDCTRSCGYICPSTSTCRTSGVCEPDPQVGSSAFQCNKTTGGTSACYDDNGIFKNPAPAGCYATWGKCNANSILKVRKDRGCNLWLSCATTIQTEPKVGAPAENLCLTLAACNSLNQQGQCNNYLPQGQCDNDPLRFCGTDVDCLAGGSCNLSASGQPTQSLQDLTFRTPTDVDKIANLSGSVVGGLDWNQIGGSTVLQGTLPWQLMQQYGGTSELSNGDFEYNPPDLDKWLGVPTDANPSTKLKIEFEDVSASINHVLKVTPAVNTTNGAFVQFSGAASGGFETVGVENYYAEARVRSNSGPLKLRFQFGFDNYRQFSVGQTATAVNVDATTAWQRITLGPFNGMNGETRVAIVCADDVNCGEFWVDDVQVRPYLQVNTNPTLIMPSCRLYPKADSPSCDYVSQDGIRYQGWQGYCLENDSQTGTCLSWWPVDILRGTNGIFGTEKTAGYRDRVPLYYCAESAGLARTSEIGPVSTSANSYNYGDNYSGGYSFTISDRSIAAEGSVPTVQTSDGTTTHPTNLLPMGAIKAVVGYGDTADGAKWLSHFSIPAENFLAVDENGVTISKDISFPTNGEHIVLRASSPSPATLGLASTIGKVWQIETVDDRNPGGSTGGVDQCKLGSSAPGGEASGPNCIFIRLLFNTENRLIGYQFDGADQEGQNINSASYKIILQVNEMCTKIVQVVSQTGKNVAFAKRVASENYRVQDLGYFRSTDLMPFGGLLQPQNNQNDPTQWLPISSEKPNTIDALNGQVRSGSPYACNGNCSTYTCLVNQPQNTTTDPTLLTKINNASQTCATTPADCQNIDSDGDAVPDGQCVGASLDPLAQNKPSQEFDAQCVSGRCQGQTSQCSASAATCAATTVVTGTSTNAAGAKSAALSTCRGITACSGKVVTSAGVSCGADVKYSTYTENSANCVATRFQGCAPGAAPGGCTCTSTGTCSSGATYQQGVLFGSACTTDSQCRVDPADTAQDQYFAQQRLRRLFAESYGVWQWSDALNSYRLLTGAGWTSPTTVCPSTTDSAGNITYTRPLYPDDYCAIPPSIIAGSAKFVNGGSSAATVTGGNGSIGLKFNTEADAEQVPLKSFTIHWGDSSISYAFPYSPRNDVANPHIFSHAYNNTGPTCSSANQKNCCTITNGRKTCEYEIRLQVKDNWGWCNNGTSTDKCPADPSTWYDTGLTVRVQP